MLIYFFLAFVALLLMGVVAYWQLVVAEGAYLGHRVVAWLYDLYAKRYDHTKQFDLAFDTLALAEPILRHLGKSQNTPVVLDIATGTGRLPLALLAQPAFKGNIVAVDSSAKMLAVAQAKLAAYAQNNRVEWRHENAQTLSFANNHFAVVTCLEAIEFFPQPIPAIKEMVRVLQPCGLLMLTNRIGPDAWKLPARAMTTDAFCALLESFGLTDVRAYNWLVDYDLVLAIKS